MTYKFIAHVYLLYNAVDLKVQSLWYLYSLEQSGGDLILSSERGAPIVACQWTPSAMDVCTIGDQIHSIPGCFELLWNGIYCQFSIAIWDEYIHLRGFAWL